MIHNLVPSVTCDYKIIGAQRCHKIEQRQHGCPARKEITRRATALERSGKIVSLLLISQFQTSSILFIGYKDRGTHLRIERARNQSSR